MCGVEMAVSWRVTVLEAGRTEGLLCVGTRSIISRYCSTIELQASTPEPSAGASRGLFAVSATVVALAGLMIRLWIHTMPVGRVNSDEAIAGLMARHFARGNGPRSTGARVTRVRLRWS